MTELSYNKQDNRSAFDNNLGDTRQLAVMIYGENPTTGCTIARLDRLRHPTTKVHYYCYYMSKFVVFFFFQFFHFDILGKMKQSRNNRMDNRRWISWLILSLVVASDKVSAIFVDEPLLYDTFPPDFIWASATSAHQIEGAWNVDGNLNKK